MRKFDNSSNRKYVIPVDLESPDYKSREAVANLLEYLDDFMNTAVLELHRIDEDFEKVLKLANKRAAQFEDKMCYVTLWADYYFFLNTVERTYRLVASIYRQLGDTGTYDRIKSSAEFNEIKTIRNAIEHLYEDAAKSGGLFYKEHRSMGPDREIVISGFSFKADESSLEPLYQIYDDISNIIQRKYVIPNKEIVDRLGLK